MQRIAAHPALHADPVLRNFLESADKVPFGWMPAKMMARLCFFPLVLRS
jgi:hypothetical protein